jgi:hypothetical protein
LPIAGSRSRELRRRGRSLAETIAAKRPLGLRVRRAERSPATPLRFGNSGPAFYCPGPGRKPAVETTPALAWHDPDGARIALPIACSTSRPLLMWQRRPTTGQSERTQCAAGGARSAHGVRTAMPEFRGRARNQPDEPLHGHLLHCCPQWAARDISDSLLSRCSSRLDLSVRRKTP